ncbi:MobF family relaxase [Lyngbya confervoides]|uniref:Relaxase domain-containing protein n=1 Tax=Lyngbya confervoides BDU141951 TaxID=1574623 RepID=A0ABD4T7P1_9CYAN|nr:MobF family relaxase [Lyngbya confervoides]MCM1984455.1 relaxase domain-containing protein [Lyngbya confervoides BDU141951]
MVASLSKAMSAPSLERYHSRDNYYSQGDGLENAEWFGEFAEAQGLTGQIESEDWAIACHGMAPDGTPLRRQQRGSRAGWDMTLSASKSVSLKALIDRDERVLDAHRQAVKATVTYIEANCIHAQIKRNGEVISEQTQQGHFALFEHDDNRNQEPQLHTHVVILNQTRCADSKSRTLDSRELFNQKKIIGAYYDHALAYHLRQQGYALDWTSDHTFEIQGYDKDQLERFSSRRQEIRDYLERQNINLEQATEAQKTIACLESRAAKVYKLSPVDHEIQHQAWQNLAQQLGIQHPQPRQILEESYQQLSHPGSLNEVIDAALESATTYQVAVSRQHLLREALRHSQGWYDPEAIAQAIDEDERLTETEDQRLTTEKHLKREQAMIQSANAGQGTQASLSNRETVEAIAQAKGLNEGQTRGLKHLGLNQDQVMLVQGDAGVGKTYTLNAFRELFPPDVQQHLRGLAPSAAAAQVLQDEAKLSSQTVDAYLYTPNHRLDRNQVLIVDEAGMLSHQQMSQLLEKTQALNHRLILIGDTKQLSSIEAGAPFRLLQDRSTLPTVNLNENLRQVTPQLKEAVDLAASQRMISALEVLDRQEAIAEIKDEDERLRAIAQRYLARPHERQVQTLVLCDTNRDRQIITEQIRTAYVEQGKLGQEAIQIQTLQPKRLDEQAIAQAYNYEVGDVIRFRKASQKFPSLYYRVTQVDGDRLIVRDSAGETVALPLEKYRDREVFRCQEFEIRVGDRLRFTRNQRDWDQINGQLFTIEGFNSDGTIQINSRGKSYGVSLEQLAHVDYAYCQTVYGAQGWTAKEAIWAPGQRPGKELTYVALSRAKERLEVVTLDRQGLGLSVQRTQAQENVLDLVPLAQPPAPERQEAVPQVSDAKLWQTYEAVQAWQKQPQPEAPNPTEGPRLEQQVARLQEQEQRIQLLVSRQASELAGLGKPRSLFNWKGPSPAEVEARRQLLGENQQKLTGVKRRVAQLQQSLKTWKTQRVVYEAWERSPQTQQMREAIQRVQQPESQARLAQIREGYAWFALGRQLAEQAGKRDGKIRRIQGQTYFLESDGQYVLIMREGKPIFHASDERQKGGIVQTFTMEMTKGDRQTIRDLAQRVQERIRQQERQQRRSHRRGMSL